MSNQQLQDTRYNPPLSPLSKGGSKRGSSCIMHRASCIVYRESCILLLLAFLFLPSLAGATMQNYCLIPPYVMRGGVPPNLVIAYEKGSAIMNRAYSTTYSSTTEYYGFFDYNSNYTYTYNSAGKHFIKDACTPSAAASTNCFTGNVLNWALMSSLDLSRKALIGFGSTAPGKGSAAGELFTYTGTLDSKGQGNAATVSGAGYTFCLSAASGSLPTKIKIGFGVDCSASIVVDGDVVMRFSDEYRLGLIQRIGDLNKDLSFDVQGPRFAVRRWNSGNAMQADIMRDSPVLNSTEQVDYFKSLLNATSVAPPDDPQDSKLANMMIEISKYFRGASSAYEDNDAYSQTPYSWALDPLRACRKSFVLYITTGVNFGDATVSPLPPACSSLVYPNEEPYISAGINNTSVTDPFARNTCAAFNTDHYITDGTPPRQNVSSFIVHTTFYGGAATPATKARLQYAANISDGLYIEVNKPGELLDALEKAVNEMLRRASSGTAASVLASGEGSGANLIQVIFYPETPRTPLGMFDRRASWLGRLTNYWYYVDPFFASSTILDDSGTEPPDKILDTSNDKKVIFRFSHADDATVADRYNFGSTTLIDSIRFERTKNLWDAGVELWKRDLSTSPRTIKTTTGSGLIDFSTGNRTALKLLLQAASDDEAEAIIRYVRGEDNPTVPIVGGTTYSYRTRTVAVDLNGDGDTSDAGEGAKVWKLGDILNSTPRIVSWIPLNTYDQVYSDTTYKSYIDSAGYKNRGLVFVGGNDGMLHAVKLGTLELVNDPATPNIKARLTGSDLGKEMWAFIPKNALPYLKYLTEIDYCHTYTVDLTPYIFDASINKPAACGAGTDYWNCTKTVESWRTVLIGGMRYGGACRNSTTTCTDVSGDGAKDCVNTPVANNGYSSYFALDITDQNNPILLWEFSNEQLGFTTTGPAVVKINARNVSGGVSTHDTTKNGRWFVVLGSGPTGPNTGSPDYQFMGRSDQNLRLFVLDLKTGQLATTNPIDTGIQFAFAGSMLNANIDTDIDYQDDVVYIPYVKREGTSPNFTWTNGGVGRLVTKEDLNGNDISATGNTALNPANWAWSVVMDNIGPVTSAVANLINKSRGELWLYFGSGRYYFEQGVNTDDATGQRQIFGIKEPCYSTSGFNSACTTTRSFCATPTTSNPCGDVRNVTDIANVPSDPTAAGYHGWYINLDPAVSTASPNTYTNCDGVGTTTCAAGKYGYCEGNPATVVCRDYRAERVITDPLTTTTGLVFFTAYKPYFDICAYGGKSFIWATKYDTGGSAGSLLKGKAVIQTGTGAIEQVDLSTAFTLAGGRKSGALEGVPPTAQGLSIMSTPPPVKRVIHVRER